MRIFTKLLLASVAAVMVVTGGALVAQADDTPSVYTTPGGQISGGRLWNTTCEKYSSDVVRCRAEIWATTVSYRNGRYLAETRWVFNNLSYLYSSRATWGANNLARTNKNWTSGGRQWRTECDTATTGKGGCRSYVYSDVVKVKGGGFVKTKEWVFNNLVLFSSRSIPAVSSIPPWVIDSPGQWLEPQGLRWGPIRLNTDGETLGRLGYVRKVGPSVCRFWASSQSLKNRGVRAEFRLYGTWFVALDTGFIPTKAGARVGMTVGQVKALYGAAFKVVPKEHYGETQYFGSVREGAYELQFRVQGASQDDNDGKKTYEYAPTRPLLDGDVVAEISAQNYTTDVSWDVC